MFFSCAAESTQQTATGIEGQLRAGLIEIKLCAVRYSVVHDLPQEDTKLDFLILLCSLNIKYFCGIGKKSAFII